MRAVLLGFLLLTVAVPVAEASCIDRNGLALRPEAEKCVEVNLHAMPPVDVYECGERAPLLRGLGAVDLLS